MTDTAPTVATPTVTVVIPMRNEAPAIERCLRAVIAQDLEDNDFEVVVIDGDSTDGCGTIARSVLSAWRATGWEIIHNRSATTPSNLNRGLEAARGTIICRIDARSIVPTHYLRHCRELLSNRKDLAVVGGRQVALAPHETTVGLGIARALNNRYTMGFARYRRGSASGPADTVYLGAFRTDELRGADGWNESFPTNQDFELNRRMADLGTIWFDADLEVGYLPRATVVGLWHQYRRFGMWKARYWTRSGDTPQPRQLAILAVPPVLALTWVASLAVSGRRARRFLALLPVVALLGVEELGSQRHSGGTSARVVSLTASAAVMGGWWSGAVQGLLTKDHELPTTDSSTGDSMHRGT